MPKSKFEILPDRDEIEDLRPDLRFHPVCHAPDTLTQDQIDRFNRDGYLSGLAVLSRSEAAESRQYFDGLLQRVIAEGGDSYSISTAHLSYGRVYDLLCHPKIVAYLRDLLGPNVIGWGSHYFCKMPHDGKAVAWHQDATYWPLSPSKTVTVWLAIDDADTENACMRFIPGSHLHGKIAYRESGTGEANVLNQTVDNALDFGDPVDNCLSAGEISLHSDLLLHGSKANDSDRRRCGLTLRYCAAEVRAGMDWHLKGVVVSGDDQANHWANPSRPKQQ